MTLSLVAASQDIDGNGPHVWALDAGSNPGAIVVGIAQAQRDQHITAIDYGGKALSIAETGSWSTGGHQRGEIWEYIGTDIPTGSNNVTVTVTGAEKRSACAYALTAGGPITQLSTQSKSTASGSVSFTSTAGLKSGISFVAGSVKNTGGSVLGGTTADIYRDLVADDKYFTVARDTTAATGSRLTGSNNTWLCGAAQVMYIESDIEMTPDPFGTELGFSASANVTIASSTMLLPETSFGTEIGFAPGIAITKTHDRQVALVGEGIDLVEMTEDGAEGQVLTKHAKTKPTWEDAAVVGTDRLLTGDGISDPPEHVWWEDGLDFIYEGDMD